MVHPIELKAFFRKKCRVVCRSLVHTADTAVFLGKIFCATSF